MSALDHTDTASDQHTWESLRRAISAEIAGRPLHRSGTVYVPADLPELGDVLRRYESEGRPVVLVHEDGTERVLDAREDELRQFLRWGLLVGIAAAVWALAKGRPVTHR